jgi:hypothetical protein
MYNCQSDVYSASVVHPSPSNMVRSKQISNRAAAESSALEIRALQAQIASLQQPGPDLEDVVEDEPEDESDGEDFQPSQRAKKRKADLASRDDSEDISGEDDIDRYEMPLDEHGNEFDDELPRPQVCPTCVAD